MIAPRTCLIGFIVLAIAQSTAAADPIQVNVWGEAAGHNINQSFTLSDPSQSLTVGSFSQQLFASSGPNGYYGSGTLDSSFVLEISVGAPGSPSAGDSVTVTGPISGSYSVATPMLPNMNGSVSGSGTSATLYLSPGSSPADVPPYLADLLNNPGRVSYGGSITGTISGASTLTTSLGIAPPVDPNAVVPAPEPSMLATAMMAVASFAIVRRLRSRPSRAIEVHPACPAGLSGLKA
jgi:hypothetical protein